MTIEWYNFWLGIVVVLGGLLAAALRIGYVVGQTVKDVTVETDAKIGRVYERFDKYKEQMEISFVRKESCQLSHGSSAREFADLKSELARLNEKVDALLMRGK